MNQDTGQSENKMKDKYLNLIEILKKISTSIRENYSTDARFNDEISSDLPPLTRKDLAWRVELVAKKIERNIDTICSSDAPKFIEAHLYLAQNLLDESVPNLFNRHISTVNSFIFGLDDLEKTVDEEIRLGTEKVYKSKEMLSKELLNLTKKIRAMEARLKDLEPRAHEIDQHVSRIEDASEAADRLPTDLESLNEAREKIHKILIETEANKLLVDAAKTNAEATAENLTNKESDAERVLEKCETAYASATSQGLAAAFQERSKQLNSSILYWVIGLIVALSAGGYFGSLQIAKLSSSMSANNNPIEIVLINLILAFLSVGAPIWFAWISTKQIGDRFKLSEDYAFKASISRAYEGYRREAARLDADLEISLLNSALTRLDELPLRLIDAKSHGSPWHELLSSEIIKEAAKNVPGFVSSVGKMANSALEKLAAPNNSHRKPKENTPKTGDQEAE